MSVFQKKMIKMKNSKTIENFSKTEISKNCFHKIDFQNVFFLKICKIAAGSL